MEIRSLPWMARPSPIGSVSPATTRGFSVTHSSSASLWSCILGHWSFLSPRPCRNVPEKVAPALFPGFIGSSGQLVKSPDFTLYREFLFSIESVAQLFEGLPSLLQSRSQLLVRRFGCGFQTLIGEYHAWGSSSLHHKNLSITLRYLLAVQFGRRAFWTPFGRPIGHSLLRQLHHGSVCLSPAKLSWARQMWSGRSHSPNMVFGRKYALHHGMIIIRST